MTPTRTMLDQGFLAYLLHLAGGSVTVSSETIGQFVGRPVRLEPAVTSAGWHATLLSDDPVEHAMVAYRDLLALRASPRREARAAIAEATQNYAMVLASLDPGQFQRVAAEIAKLHALDAQAPAPEAGARR